MGGQVDARWRTFARPSRSLPRLVLSSNKASYASRHIEVQETPPPAVDRLSKGGALSGGEGLVEEGQCLSRT